MGDYTSMSTYYDVIMTSGYYDYKKIVDGILNQPSANILEIGCGTGLILEEIAKRNPAISLTGMDLTQAMLNIAQKRLESFSQVNLSLQNITDFSLQNQFECVFSYGGVWYFVIDGDQEPLLVSHLAKGEDNESGFDRLAAHVCREGRLLLGIQGPHFDYEKPISTGLIYSQRIEPNEVGFTKHYYLHSPSETLMAQTIHYRTYSFSQAKQLMSRYGFHFQPNSVGNGTFLEFKKM